MTRKRNYNLPWEIWIMILELLDTDSLMELRRTSKRFKGIVNGFIMMEDSIYRRTIKDISEDLPNAIMPVIRNKPLYLLFSSEEGKILLENKILKWMYYGPQGPYKPYMYYKKEILPTRGALIKMYGISEEEYWEYCNNNWNLLTLEEKRMLKWICRLKNVLERIEKGEGRGYLNGKIHLMLERLPIWDLENNTGWEYVKDNGKVEYLCG